MALLAGWRAIPLSRLVLGGGVLGLEIAGLMMVEANQTAPQAPPEVDIGEAETAACREMGADQHLFGRQECAED